MRGKCRGKDVAIKVLHKPITDEKALTSFKKEVAIMSTIFHPNICLFMGACTQPGNFFIVSEYLPKGDLSKLLHDPNVHLSLYTKMKMAQDAALGMNWLHCSNPVFIHRDLKSSNLLVDETNRVKVCDFGLSQIKQHGESLKDTETAKGTPLWMAPEVMMFKCFNEKCDVYSFGIVLWEILSQKEPFPHHVNFQKFKKAVCYENERPEIPDGCLPSLKKLVQKCWVGPPEDRPSFKTIISELDKIIVDAAVSDEFGRSFWKQYFMAKELQDEVPWDEFAREFCEFLGLEGVNFDLMHCASLDPTILGLKCLKSVLASPKNSFSDKSEEVVTLEKFGKILQWFGPIGDPQATHKHDTIIDSTRNLMKYTWFHGDTDTETAQEKLTGKPGGTFLIRFSSMDGWFTISQITPTRGIRHQRIKHKPGSSYILDGEPFSSLNDLVVGKNLTLACPGSRFQHIFQDNPPDLLGYVSM